MSQDARSTFTPPTCSYAGYIFDCDGTLADTMPLHHLAWQQALEEGGAPFVFGWDLFVSRAGMTLEQTVLELNAEFACALDPSSVAESQRRHYAALEPRTTPILDVVTFARALAKTCRISVASGSLRPTVERTLERIGLRSVFPVIVTPEDVTRGKPHPDLFLLAAQRMGVPPAQCVVFEDAELGFEAARRAGMDVVCVSSYPPR